MKMITAYRIVWEDPEKDFNEEVNQMIAEGWQPFGGIATRPHSVNDEYHNPYVTAELVQAMVRYGEDPEPVSPSNDCLQCGAVDRNCSCVPF